MSQYGITWRMMPALALHWDASITCVQPPPSASSQQTFCEGMQQPAMLAMFTSHKSIHRARHCVMTPSNCQTWTLDKPLCFTFPAMASSSRPEKLAKLQHFKASLPFHSQSSLHAMIEEAKEMGLPDFSTPKHQREARRQTIAECHGGDLGPLIQETVLQNKDGEPVPFVFTSLLTYLMALFARGGSWAQLFSSVHAKCPSSPQQPWKLIVYLDELVPGNVLGRAERKSWAWYCSFLELGNHLSSIHSWLTIALARSTKVSKLEAGVSQITASLLKSIFCNPLSFPQTGIILKDPKTDTTIRFHFDFGMVLADGAAQKQVWGSKGDSGLKFCFFCKNVRASGTTEANMHSNITKYSQLDLASDQDVLQSYATLHSRKETCSKADFELWQQATGWSHSDKALLLDQDLVSMNLLKPCSQFAHDPMHGVLQGTAPICLYHFLCSMEEDLDIWQFLENFFPLWQFPKNSKTPHLGTFFQKKKVASHKNSQKISCQASECLALFPVVRHFVHSVANPQKHQPKACAALLAMANLIDQIQDGNLANLISRDTLVQAAENAITTFQQAWPDIPLIKKWHWQFHMGDTHQRFGRLVSCFANERKHKPIGALAQALQNTKNFETNLLEQVLSQEICKLDQQDVFKDGVYLVSSKPASKATLQTLAKLLGEPIAKAQSSLCASVTHTQCCKGDVVLYQTNGTIGVAEIQMHLHIHDVLTTLVKVWHIQEWKPSQQFARCHIDQSLGFVPTKDILVPIIHHQSQGNAKVLLPYQIYSKYTLPWKKRLHLGNAWVANVCFCAIQHCGLVALHIIMSLVALHFFVARMAWHHSWQRFSFLWWNFPKFHKFFFEKMFVAFEKRLVSKPKKVMLGKQKK